MTQIKEIFTSIQGEGPFVGYKQLFIRFCGCNLNCAYCDTDFNSDGAVIYTPEELAEVCNKHSDCHSVSLTGGEPLLNVEFLKSFLPLCDLPLYLETNGTLYDELGEIVEYLDYISMDIKLPSCTKLSPQWDKHEKFLNIAKDKNTCVKVVFDENITEFEIEKIVHVCSKYGVEIVLQPKMNGNIPSVSSEFMSEITNKFTKLYNKTRLIPQVHKFIGFI